jgi:hypothetical protein
MLDFHVGQIIVSPSDLQEIGQRIGSENVRVDGPLFTNIVVGNAKPATAAPASAAVTSGLA